MIQTVGWNRWFWIMLAIALGLRLVLAIGVQLKVSQTPGRVCLISGDAEGYWELAGKLVAGDAYSIHDPPRRLLRMPGFPMLLALPRLAFGNNPFAARLVLAVIGTMACGLTYWLGRELAGDAVGVIASFYTATSPVMALFSVLFLSETAFAAAMLASLIAAAKLVQRKSNPIKASPFGTVGLALLTGILIGLGTYMRPTWLLVGPGLGILVTFICPGPVLSRIALGGWICLGLGLSLSPWTIRNYHITGHFISTTLWDGPSLYDGLNPTATGESDMAFFDRDNLLKTLSEYDMNREYRRRAWDFAIEHPGKVILLAVRKQSRFWSPAPQSSQFNYPSINALAWLAYLPLVVFAFAGAWFARGNLWLLILTVAPILFFAALHLLFVGSLRYRLPAEYPLAVLSAVGVNRWWQIRNRTAV